MSKCLCRLELINRTRMAFLGMNMNRPAKCVMLFNEVIECGTL